jgi:hypothetical protein
MASPFLKRSVRCPVCHKTREHRMFRVRQFLPMGLEDDQHVTEYKWQSEKVEAVHPPYYALYFCEDCYYADLSDDFKDPSRSQAGYWVGKNFGNFSPETNAVIELLGRHVDYETINFHSALCMHYLVIYIQTIVPSDLQDPFKVGRIALRLSWLYREAKQDMVIPDGPETCAGQAFGAFASFEEFVVELRKHWPEAPRDESEAALLAADFIEKAISEDSRFDQPQKYYQGVKLLLSVLNNCGDLDRAYDTIRGVYLEGMQSRQGCQKILADKTVSASRRQKVAGDMRVINTYMSDAGEFRDQFLDKLVERDAPKVAKILTEIPGLDPTAMEAVIVKSGIKAEVLHRMQQKAAAKAAKK